MFRPRSIEKAYLKLPKSSKCPFCNLEDKIANPYPRRIIKETKSMLVMNAMFPYMIWEYHDVLDHLMVVPKRHVSSMHELDAKERQEMMDIFCEFEAQGYAVYARPPQSARRTVSHIHEHLIKIADKKPRGALFLKKPYVLVKF